MTTSALPWRIRTTTRQLRPPVRRAMAEGRQRLFDSDDATLSARLVQVEARVAVFDRHHTVIMIVMLVGLILALVGCFGWLSTLQPIWWLPLLVGEAMILTGRYLFSRLGNGLIVHSLWSTACVLAAADTPAAPSEASQRLRWTCERIRTHLPRIREVDGDNPTVIAKSARLADHLFATCDPYQTHPNRHVAVNHLLDTANAINAGSIWQHIPDQPTDSRPIRRRRRTARTIAAGITVAGAIALQQHFGPAGVTISNLLTFVALLLALGKPGLTTYLGR